MGEGMLNIAVVEDDNEQAQVLIGYCERFAHENSIEFHLDHYLDGVSFLARQSDFFDIIFMDIMLDGINGMETARRLRASNRRSVLIFVTNMAQFAVMGYEVNALDFIIKPVTYPHFQMKLRRAVEIVRSRSGIMITVSKGKGGTIWQVSSEDILYLEVKGHALYIHTGSEVIQCWEPLSVLEKKLSGQWFSRCNNCYLVNLKYIKAFSGYTVTMRDGSELLVSHPKRRQFLQELTAYMGEGNL